MDEPLNADLALFLGKEGGEAYRLLFEHAPDAIFILEAEGERVGTIMAANPAATRQNGYSAAELIGRRITDINTPDSPGRDPELMRRILAGEWVRGESAHRHKDGHEVRVEINAGIFRVDGHAYILAMDRDITHRHHVDSERRQMEDRIRQAQKLESLSVMAGGIAHDFNNLLAGTMGNAELAMLELPPGSPVARRLEQIMAASERAGELIKGMLAFSGKGGIHLERLDLSQLVEEMARVMEVSIPRTARLAVTAPPGLPPVEGDGAQLRQLVMNLVLNAAEAMSGAEETITVSVDAAAVSREEMARFTLGGDLPPGTYLRLVVRDRGHGMDTATMARIFDPFFSTRFAGRGLGLAAVQGIVRTHTGAIRVESAPGEGSTFTVLLPPASSPSATPTAAPRPGTDPSRRRVVLLVDDEEIVRDMVQGILQHSGYEVLVANDGEEGLAVFGEHHRDIDIVLMDLAMPGLGGEDVLPRMRAIAPNLPVVLLSGRPLENGLPGKATTFLLKPFRATELLAAVRDALEP